ncbi:MAG: hypothetical protein PHV99_01340 [Candidatus Pacebacteria bacterium]|nr:hypothetical protein [Candidatus Paceibacterota bacterium]
MNSDNSAVVAYVASPHEGYMRFFREYAGSVLWILGEDFISEVPSLTSHMPGNRPSDAQKMIDALGIFREVHILTKDNAEAVRQYSRIIMPDEDVSRAIAGRYYADLAVFFDDRWKLRWYTGTVAIGRKPEGEEVISVDEFDRRLLLQAQELARRSPDWWRQVSAFLVREGVVLLAAFNGHHPHEQSCYVLGDPRSCFGPGERIDLSAAGHAEAALASAALKRGICTVGCDLYVTTFPCPACAYLWSESGIKRLFYADGYSLIAGAEDLQRNKVQIIRVLFDTPP